ncbi:hypothetical protein HUJ04_009721 [Dendroctonus ponderosae]|uniref:Uncharacterized protein n=2 Tax=Dendroctonus ponderosae TaxID=77166 RepID=A0AAR5PJH0_DENPD|nr:hypothetical protein HUJ04_009721 [Dendroctonus ponderosae]
MLMKIVIIPAGLWDSYLSMLLVAENLAPAELKKLKNKQRKAQKKAEQESAQAREAQVKRDQHNKSRQQGDAEADAPQLDELIPDKLARIEDPLEQAIIFLQPLQTLARDRIETHLMAFEVYYRKRKVLLMLQSIKRAHQVDAQHPKLHSCLIRFLRVVKDNQHNYDNAVSEVITTETKTLLSTKDAKTLNKEFLDSHKDSLKAALEVAIVMYQLDNKAQKDALSLVQDIANNKYTDVDIEVCTEILKNMRNGSLGSCAQSQIDSFVAKCRQRFPHAEAFKSAQEIKAQQQAQTNHGMEQEIN